MGNTTIEVPKIKNFAIVENYGEEPHIYKFIIEDGRVNENYGAIVHFYSVSHLIKTTRSQDTVEPINSIVKRFLGWGYRIPKEPTEALISLYEKRLEDSGMDFMGGKDDFVVMPHMLREAMEDM